MDGTLSAHWSEQSANSQTQSESPEREDQHDGASPSVGPEVAKLSCDNCRKRKVKCNRRLPVCSLCEKLRHHCVYSNARKRPQRRTRYSELEERLQHMEKVLVEGKPGKEGIDARSRSLPSSLHHGSRSPEGESRPYPGDLIISRPRVVDPRFSWNIPEKGLIEPLDIGFQAPSPGPDTDEDPASYICGSLPIFSARGVQWIDQLLGDCSFSTMVKGIRRPEGGVSQNLGLLTPPANLLPSHKLADSCVRGFFATLNSESPLFQEEMIASYLNCHHGGNQILKVGYIAAINIIVAFQRFRCYPIRYKADPDIHLGNALALLPRLIIEGPSILNVGAVMCIALYFIFASECERAASILGIAVQMMITAGYNVAKSGSDPEHLFQQRLFWQAYIMSSDASVYLGKAPGVWDSIVSNLPERDPADGRANLAFQDGSTLNVLYQRVTLAKIQGKVWSMLYSPSAMDMPHHQIYDHAIELDHELEIWRLSMPSISSEVLYDGNESRSIYLTLLHLRYYQLVINIHSVLFIRASSPDPRVRKMRATPSVARCVQAARDAVSLLGHFNKDHPFMGLLAPHLAWCCDVLCVHVLQNKQTAGVYQDIARLEKVAKTFEKFTAEYGNKVQSQVANMLYFVAAYGVRSSKTVIQQPAEDWYDNTYAPAPVSEAPQYTTPPVATGLFAHQAGDFPINYDGSQGTPQYMNDGGEFMEPAPWNGIGFDTESQAGMSFFIHS
ncbi:hypothetical protein ONS96_007101 [Cadophora gregata f. sp. sojae]|nr:hypothetical protein ONS96_007101 [Cadophora gregata f. sp. sojae]